jgi:hypothetical protein
MPSSRSTGRCAVLLSRWPAAARIARALGLPYAIKARGSDIHVWGQSPAALRQMQAAARAPGRCSACRRRWPTTWPIWACPNAITVHYTGLDRGRFHPARAPPRAILAERFHLPPKARWSPASAR